jgi:iron complex transport system permease protein
MTLASRRRSRRVTFALLFLLIVVSLAAGVGIGPVRIPFRNLVPLLLGQDQTSPHSVILREIRLPRVLLGLVTGYALALSGGTMQGLFRNPLASPYLLGIASGASAGAALVILTGAQKAFLLPLGAFAGGALAVWIVYRLSKEREGRTSTYTLLLAGVAVGALFSAVTSFLIFESAGSERMSEIIFWTMGGLTRGGWTALYILLPVVSVSSLVILLLARDLNALALGEEGAFHLGVPPERTKRLLLVSATLLTSATVAFAGTIGFVGLIVPHILRLVLGPDHRVLLPASGIAGGAFLILSDIAARTVLSPAELPVGVITAFLGGPFFLYLLKTKGGRM